MTKADDADGINAGWTHWVSGAYEMFVQRDPDRERLVCWDNFGRHWFAQPKSLASDRFMAVAMAPPLP